MGRRGSTNESKNPSGRVPRTAWLERRRFCVRPDSSPEASYHQDLHQGTECLPWPKGLGWETVGFSGFTVLNTLKALLRSLEMLKNKGRSLFT